MSRIGISEKVKLEIIEKYQDGLSIRDISKIIKKGQSTISRYLKSQNIIIRQKEETNRKFPINEDYFSSIDSSEKAYILGFFYADACNHTKTTSVSFELQETDKYIVERISKCIHLCDRPLAFIGKRKEEHQVRYRLLLISKNISSDLERLGCVPSKSLILKFPTKEQVPIELQSHFIRGYFDGDGCVHNKNYGAGTNIVFNLLGTDSFLKSIRSILEKDCNVKINQRIFKLNNIYSLSYSRKEDVRRIMNYIYNNCGEFFLTRKRNKFIDYYDTNV